MSSTAFTFDTEDVFFTYFDQLKIHEQLVECEKYADFDQDTYQTTVEEAYKFARDVFAPLNAKGDQTGCSLDAEGNVTLPEGYKEAWDQMREGGWTAPRADPDYGGSGMPYVIGAFLSEVMSGANMSLQMYVGLSSAAARVIKSHGPEHLRRAVAEKIFAGEWGGTMCLTEADAGSSVGDNRTKATPSADDPNVWLLEGEKIFITGGDSNLVENICHLVLARTPGSPEGTKGLSLFMVPKFWFDAESLELGERNGAHVLKLEHKMGIKSSATCVLGIGARGPCRGWMVGKEREGIRLMFEMMNEARIGVGVQGLAAGSAAFQYARAYVHERVQGTSLKHMRDPNAKRVPIVQHPDVRRMLMNQKVLVETMRSMAYRLALSADIAESHPNEDLRAKTHRRVDLLVPVVKSMCTDLGFDIAVTAVQIFGGYGFTQEFPVEQLVRDAKIQSIYEGTNGIQALDLLGRKMRMEGGRLFMEWMQDAKADIEAAQTEGFDAQATALGKAIDAVAAAAMHIAGVGQKDIDEAMLQAVPFLQAFGYTVLGQEALDQARVAKRKIAARGETNFLKGKLLNLDYFTATFLPQVTATSKAIRHGDVSCLDPSLFTAN
ncbi:Acyl-CoA dehydrogenase [Enhygromyxa salina]|uniref:Acyl-CoA dehydrogenase n=1 Tax=Enhygromyxa salina TaxID=215803 RepID=A0A0C1Z340_9BACT|nr:acyl-CoA dehydrogenase [Enhygromyxa salina]KIG11999.1 Acyl-CoA dehydrogenase [Enhygromyxa salina]